MDKNICTILAATMDRLRGHAQLVELANTDEATFRSFFIAELKRQMPSAMCQTEWHRYDLLVQVEGRNALIEFKYYINRRTLELTGKLGKWKGEAGTQNEDEFWKCVDKLRKNTRQPIHAKYLILVYERNYPRRSMYSFTKSYDSLSRGDRFSRVLDVDHAMSDVLRCKLLHIG